MRRHDWDIEDHLGEPEPTRVTTGDRGIEPAAALVIAVALVVGVVLFGAYVAPRVAGWLVERGVG